MESDIPLNHYQQPPSMLSKISFGGFILLCLTCSISIIVLGQLDIRYGNGNPPPEMVEFYQQHEQDFADLVLIAEQQITNREDCREFECQIDLPSEVTAWAGDGFMYICNRGAEQIKALGVSIESGFYTYVPNATQRPRGFAECSETITCPSRIGGNWFECNYIY
jgi:hypothetical protein